MTTHRTWLIDVKDLRLVSIRCGQCQTRVVVDVASEKAGARAGTGQIMPLECPSCRTAFDSAVKYLNRWQEVYAALKGIAGVQIEVQLPELG